MVIKTITLYLSCILCQLYEYGDVRLMARCYFWCGSLLPVFGVSFGDCDLCRFEPRTGHK